MSLDKKNIRGVFLITLLLTLYLPAVSHLKLLFFAPFLIILYYQKSYLTCLWFSLFCGLLLDILSSHSKLGLYALNFCCSTAFLYHQRRNFFADSLSTLPIMTFFFSILSTFLQIILLYMFEGEMILSWKWFLTDLFLLPCEDATFAFICFIIPSFLLGNRPKKGKDYFYQKG